MIRAAQQPEAARPCASIPSSIIQALSASELCSFLQKQCRRHTWASKQAQAEAHEGAADGADMNAQLSECSDDAGLSATLPNSAFSSDSPVHTSFLSLSLLQ